MTGSPLPTPSPTIAKPGPGAGAPACWVLSEGVAGTENQCLGLAEALDLPFVVKRLAVAAPWRFLPPPLWPPGPAGCFLAPGSDSLAGPPPRVVIAAGRKLAPVAASLRRAGRGRTVVIFLQRPPLPLARFDAVVAPSHDRLDGANVIETLGALTRVTPERLDEGRRYWEARLPRFPHPRVAVLFGGPSRRYALDAGTARAIGAALANAARRQGASLLVTVSRRTGAKNDAALRQALAGLSRCHVWDNRGENPYWGFLALADAIVVTADSVSMVSDAASAGKPVYVVDLPGGSARFARFHTAMREAGLTRRFDGAFDPFPAPGLREARRVAAMLRDRFDL